ncbi:MAG TPA: ABC transporter permease [Gemmatimonadaceae bacterium]|nr:ABC transporter permease [Gemmatimonadaceae bacterium]
MDSLLKDLGYAIRSLRQHPAFALTAILTLALGIGASTAIFSVVNAVLLRPLPYADADRLVLIWGDMRARKVNDFPFSPPTYKDLREQTTSFEDIASVTPARVGVSVNGETPEQAKGLGVTPNILSVLGARVIAGRDFEPADAVAPPAPPPPPPGQAPVGPPPAPPTTMAILNHGYWQRRFGGDQGVIGKTVDVQGNPTMIVGVLAPGFEVLFPPNTNIDPNPDILFAQRINYETASRINVFMRLIGRLKPGVTLAAANNDVERVSARARELYPISKAADTHYRVEAMREDLVTDVRPAILALMGAVTFVLLIACANVANLLLVRAAARERELAVRAALGSSPWRLVRQLLGESLVLSLIGAAAGLGLAYAGIKVLVALAPENLPRLDLVRIDPWVLGFATLAAVVAAGLFGIMPALKASKPDLAEALRSGGRTPGLGGGKLLRNAVVTAEVALSFVLLIGGGLMLRSFIELSRVDPGFNARGLLTFNVGGRGGQTPDQRRAAVADLKARLQALPGVKSVTASFPLPLDGNTVNSRWGPLEAAADQSKFQQANLHVVLPGYFEAMGTRVIEGRVFTEADSRPDHLGVVIDNVLARKAFPGERAVGKKLLIRTRGQEPEILEVIGVVQQQRHEQLAYEDREAIFLPDGFFGHGFVGAWAVRLDCRPGAPCDPNSMAATSRRVVNEFDARLPVSNMQAMTTLVDQAMSPTRFALVLIGVFAAVAAILACVGLYGVLTTAVRQRTAEIGMRMTFGATSGNIFGLMIGEGMKLSAAGLVIGLIGAVALTRVMGSMLVGVSPTDPATYAAILVLFLAIAVLACLIPARRAASLDPAVAIRQGE